MLTAIVITVTPVAEVTGPAFTGRAVQAWFLNQVRAADPELSARIHAGDATRPYTVSDLVGAGPIRAGRRQLSPERQGWLRITALTPELSGVLLEQIVPALPGTQLDLGGPVVRVDGVATQPSEHRWAGQASPQALLVSHSLAPGDSRRLSMRFASATTFRSQGRNIPFPLPELVFGSLVNKWNEFMPVALHPDARRFAEERIVASKYKLRSKYVQFGPDDRGAAVGAGGACRYHVQSGDRYWTSVIRALAAFAFFAGVGARTTVGLGQATLWDEEARVPAGF